jgi:precorrin-8X/cobalt-precorrin-8 methylmutase
MLKDIQWIKPAEIEKQSFGIISELMGARTFDSWQEPMIKRVIHTTADFEYVDLLIFSENAVQQGITGFGTDCQGYRRKLTGTCHY